MTTLRFPSFAPFLRAAAVLMLGLGVSLAAAPAKAVTEAQAQSRVESVIEQVVATILAPGALESKRPQFRAILEGSSDMRQIAGIALGRYARAMNDAQKGVYIDLLTRYTVTNYMKQFANYGGEPLRVTRVEQSSRGDVLVTSQIQGGAQAWTIQWVVSESNGRVIVKDMIVEGISMLITTRDQITGMLDSRGGDIDRFLADFGAHVASF